MNPNDRITPDNINSQPSQPAIESEALAQQTPFAQDTTQSEVSVQPAAAQQPVQASPTVTPFKLPQQIVQRVSNPGVEYYREDTLQKAHDMREILHKQPKAWTMVPLGPGEKPDSMLPVGINGYFVYVRKGVMVEVPFQVAQMIADSFNQDRLIGAENDLSQNEDKQRALA